MNRPGSRDQLHYLADLYGIRTSYLDMHRIVQPASDAALLAVLNALGAPVAKMEDVPSAIRERRRQYWQQIVEPVIVSRDGNMPAVSLNIPAALLKTSFPAAVTLENGETREWVWRADESAVQESALAAGSRYFSLSLSLPERLPPGYHQLTLDLPGRTAASLIISAPVKAFQPPSEDGYIWGAFIPLYALHSRRSWGAGDLADLSNLMRWVSSLGGRLVGLLPLLPVFLNSRLGPGPYMPASRLFWNDFYLDVSRVPELSFCPEARKLMDSSGFQESLSVLRTSPLVNYRRQADLKRKVLELLLDCLLTGKSGRQAGFRSYIRSHPALEDYAGFRAAGEKYGIDWRRWPHKMRGGKLDSGDFVDNVRQYHLYAQWLAQEQISDISQKARQDRFYLYLDLPVGVHPLSYDVWRERESFVAGVNGGAPPDPVFTSGQNWCFPPLHPENIRRQGYRYIINTLRHHLQAAGMLRIDHMMNFHRLFWIPKGMENREGVYVNYRSEELYAILALESCRYQSVIIGEDLGMVPPEVRPAMEDNGIYRMYVGQYELVVENQMGKIPRRSMASLNTHDMFPFSAFWQEKDIRERLRIKLINEETAQKELAQRQQIKSVLAGILGVRGTKARGSRNSAALLKQVLNLLAGGPEYAFLVNLEDLWQETRPQNIPGTRSGRNWRRKARCAFEEFSLSPVVLNTLKDIDRLRKGDRLL